MEKLTMCRICLVENVRTHEVANKYLQRMYEKLTDIPFVTEDCRPMLACFFCYTKLKQCCQLQRKCLKAEEAFAQMLNGDYERIPLEYQEEIEFYGGFIKTPTQRMSIDDVCEEESGTFSEPAVCGIEDDVDIKVEHLSDEVEGEYLQDFFIDQGDMPSHHSELDAEVKTEIEEHDVPENTRAPVAKKPKPDIRKAKLEDTITVKQKKHGTGAPVAKKPKLDIRKAKLEDTITGKQKKHGTGTTRNKTSKSVTYFRGSILSDTVAKPKVENSILNKDNFIEETSIQKNVKQAIETAIDTNNRNDSKQDHFGCKILNGKGIDSDGISFPQKLCKPYTCDICQRSFNRKANLKSHILLHTGEKRYQCDTCLISFKSKGNLKGHIRVHTGGKPYKCNTCQRSFNRKANLKSHIRVHTGEKSYKCVICQRSFKTKNILNGHIRIHTAEKSYKCEICQHSFQRKSNLKTHIRVHTGEKPYKCRICQRSYNTRNNLNMHISHRGITDISAHSEEPYKCDICQRSFYTKKTLNDHIRIHTGEKRYECDLCQNSFIRKDNLRNHMRLHTGKKSYKCNICQRSFNRKDYLKSHIRVHTGEKPYKCRICQRSFAQKHHLKAHHHRTHFEKPYKCDICQQRFIHQGPLDKHMSVHIPFANFGKSLDFPANP